MKTLVLLLTIFIGASVHLVRCVSECWSGRACASVQSLAVGGGEHREICEICRCEERRFGRWDEVDCTMTSIEQLNNVVENREIESIKLGTCPLGPVTKLPRAVCIEPASGETRALIAGKEEDLAEYKIMFKKTIASMHIGETDGNLKVMGVHTRTGTQLNEFVSEALKSRAGGSFSGPPLFYVSRVADGLEFSDYTNAKKFTWESDDAAAGEFQEAVELAKALVDAGGSAGWLWPIAVRVRVYANLIIAQIMLGIAVFGLLSVVGVGLVCNVGVILNYKEGKLTYNWTGVASMVKCCAISKIFRRRGNASGDKQKKVVAAFKNEQLARI